MTPSDDASGSMTGRGPAAFGDGPGTDLVFFEGDWPADEQTVVEAAAERIGAIRTPLPAGCPWICVRQELDGRIFYFAQWRGRMDHVVRAASAAELAERMQRLVEHGTG